MQRDRTHPHPVKPERRETSPAAAGEERVWLISDSPVLVQSIETLLAPDRVPIMKMGQKTIEQETFRKSPAPAIVLLDIGADVDRGLRTIQHLKRARLLAPMVVLTSAFSRDFGAKIISEGIRYYFSHDFCKEELLELMHTLLKRER